MGRNYIPLCLDVRSLLIHRDLAVPVLRTLSSLTIVLGDFRRRRQISLGNLVPSGDVPISLNGTSYFAAIQQLAKVAWHRRPLADPIQPLRKQQWASCW